MEKKASVILSLIYLLLSLSACDVIGTIFKTGMGVGVIIVVVIIVLILYLFRKKQV